MRPRRVAAAAVVCLLLSPTALAGQYVPAGHVLPVGQPVTVTAPGADTLVITTRPSSNISEIEKVALSEGTHTWTPETAGIVALSTPGGATQTVSVRSDSVSIPGLIVLIVAAGILFGGAGLSAVKLFGRAEPETLTDRSDT